MDLSSSSLLPGHPQGVPNGMKGIGGMGIIMGNIGITPWKRGMRPFSGSSLKFFMSIPLNMFIGYSSMAILISLGVSLYMLAGILSISKSMSFRNISLSPGILKTLPY